MELSFDLYRSLYLVRRCEEFIIDYYPDNEMKTPMHMSMGQEAVSVGVCKALAGSADVVATYRSHAAFLAQTGDHEQFFAELHGRVTGTAEGKSGSMHLAKPGNGVLCSTAIVASGIPVAVGVAFANVQLGTGRTTVAFFGDGAVDEGAFWESINAACLMRLPILLVCEDNLFAVHTHQKVRRGYKSLTKIIRQFDCIVYEDDSNDVERIYWLTCDAVRKAQENAQPAFLNLKCYRYLEHVGINDDWDSGYRSRAEFETWRARDCVLQQRSRLISGGMPESRITAFEQETDESIRTSIAKALSAPLPDPARLYRGVFYEKS
jgi:acetoin:2,6-dichlorophenolindophenol oxidoreductase subunit alpha